MRLRPHFVVARAQHRIEVGAHRVRAGQMFERERRIAQRDRVASQAQFRFGGDRWSCEHGCRRCRPCCGGVTLERARVDPILVGKSQQGARRPFPIAGPCVFGAALFKPLGRLFTAAFDREQGAHPFVKVGAGCAGRILPSQCRAVEADRIAIGVQAPRSFRRAFVVVTGACGVARFRPMICKFGDVPFGVVVRLEFARDARVQRRRETGDHPIGKSLAEHRVTKGERERARRHLDEDARFHRALHGAQDALDGLLENRSEKRCVEPLTENGGEHEHRAFVLVEPNGAFAERGLQRQWSVRCQIHAARLGGDARQLLGEERIALREHFDARDGCRRHRNAGRVTRDDRADLVAMQSAQPYAVRPAGAR